MKNFLKAASAAPHPQDMEELRIRFGVLRAWESQASSKLVVRKPSILKKALMERTRRKNESLKSAAPWHPVSLERTPF